MSYSFDIIGVAPVLTLFNYQQQVEQNPKGGKTYLGSHTCTLDSFIQSTQIIPYKPDWDWDEVVTTIINFWLNHEENIRYWKAELETVGQENLLVARVTNVNALRWEFESLLDNG